MQQSNKLNINIEKLDDLENEYYRSKFRNLEDKIDEFQNMHIFIDFLKGLLNTNPN